jgi:hypothetical protein
MRRVPQSSLTRVGQGPALAANTRLGCKGSASGLYYKHTTIVKYHTSIINKLEALLTVNARVVIYDRHVFIVQATGHQ